MDGKFISRIQKSISARKPGKLEKIQKCKPYVPSQEDQERLRGIVEHHKNGGNNDEYLMRLARTSHSATNNSVGTYFPLKNYNGNNHA